MKKRYTEEQIIGAIKEHESGVKVDDICRSKYGGLKVNQAKRLKELESENNKLKKPLCQAVPSHSPLAV